MNMFMLNISSYLINCTLPALNAASRSPDVDIGVGIAHVGEVAAVKNHVTTLNWHSYNGQCGTAAVIPFAAAVRLPPKAAG